MREIKFRFYDKIRKIMTYPDDEEKNHRYYISPDGSFSVEWQGKKPFDEKIRWWCEDSRDHERMQYTGLKDNTKWEDLTEEERKKWVEAGNLPSQWDGKKIYEGDLLDCGGGDFFEVRWNRGAWRENHYDEVLESWIDYRGPVEVIGNIYENPELLEGKNEKA